QSFVENLSLQDSVLFVGFKENIYEYLGFFDVYVMPSLTAALPMGLLEAMLAKVPIVASSVGGIPECLDGGKAGILVSPDDPGALENSLRRCLQSSALRVKMAERACEIVST